MKPRSIRLLFVLVIILVASAAHASSETPRSIILIIGDGMGIGAITAARAAEPGENGALTLDRMPVTGLVKTHSASRLVTDSGASGTALATGKKTSNGRISVDPAGEPLKTITELAAEMGKSFGVVTTDSVTGATPAVFYSHCESRDKQEEIASQLVDSGISVAMGSGRKFFVPRTDENKDGREDGRDLIELARQRGFGVSFDAQSLAADTSERLLGLFVFDETGPSLRDMLGKAVSVLSKDKDGFFLMAESYLPDKGGHRNDAATSVKGVLDLDNALEWALEYAQRERGTLVIVTADHDTGGLAVLDRDDANPKFKPGWVSGGHTGNMVALYAYGPGAEKFAGTHDNTDIPRKFAELWGKALGN